MELQDAIGTNEHANHAADCSESSGPETKGSEDAPAATDAKRNATDDRASDDSP